MTPSISGLPDAVILYWDALFSSSESSELFAALLEQVEWSCKEILIAGRRVMQPRRVAWYGDPQARYTYSGVANEPLPWIPPLLEIRERVEAASGERFNSVLANHYRDGSDSMGWHSDNEPELGPEPTIASVSFGATRRFLLKHRRRKELRATALELGDGSLLLMRGPTQDHWRHSVPKTRRAVGGRVNLTFRWIHSADA